MKTDHRDLIQNALKNATAAVMMAFLSNCDSGKRVFDYRETSSRSIEVSCRDWAVYLPVKWKLQNRDKNDRMSFVHLKRELLKSLGGTPFCLIAYERVEPGVNLREYVLGRLN